MAKSAIRRRLSLSVLRREEKTVGRKDREKGRVVQPTRTGWKGGVEGKNPSASERWGMTGSQLRYTIFRPRKLVLQGNGRSGLDAISIVPEGKNAKKTLRRKGGEVQKKKKKKSP